MFTLQQHQPSTQQACACGDNDIISSHGNGNNDDCIINPVEKVMKQELSPVPSSEQLKENYNKHGSTILVPINEHNGAYALAVVPPPRTHETDTATSTPIRSLVINEENLSSDSFQCCMNDTRKETNSTVSSTRKKEDTESRTDTAPPYYGHYFQGTNSRYNNCSKTNTIDSDTNGTTIANIPTASDENNIYNAASSTDVDTTTSAAVESSTYNDCANNNNNNNNKPRVRLKTAPCRGSPPVSLGTGTKGQPALGQALNVNPPDRSLANCARDNTPITLRQGSPAYFPW